MSTTRIQKVGFEIEGGWAGSPGVAPFTDCKVIADHSINGQTLGGAKRIQAPHVGEVVSEPIPYANVLEYQGPPEWETWLFTHWPNAEPEDRTNRTCGFHIHLSVGSPLEYAHLTSKSFLVLLRDRMIEVGKDLKLPKKHTFWERVYGGNTFCTFFFDAGAQMAVKQKGINKVRYGWLNFSYGLHGTMEFRALPTFRDSHVAIRFAREYFELVDYWLAQQLANPEPLSRTFTFKG